MKKAAATRLHILQKSFELIYAKGYQNASIDDILATTAVTKGAFYYHFKNKDEMGLAIINELMKPTLKQGLVDPLQNVYNPLDAIYQLIYNLLLKDPFLRVEYGCPAANFTQEMAPWNKEFTLSLNAITKEWEETMNSAIESGIKQGIVKSDANAYQITLFVMSGYWGIRNFGKLANTSQVYKPYLKELKRYLNNLKTS
ncbi:TetR/AcrR family transcriptional regulator [Sphingobacterium corticis]|uniref:TetR/AcrR family transcriptional regulator n=1 Tax=Sphingobacterium corticis TaxID=1812823 RepID=A0ABW5NJX4_9SPHI